MKTTTKFLIAGFVMLGTGLSLILAGCIITDSTFAPIWAPSFPFFIPGIFITMSSISLIVTGFRPKISKTYAKLHAETMDYAGKDITDASIKSVDVVGPAITKVAHSVKKELYNTKYCGECGAEIPKDSKFCNKCGKPQP